MTGNNTKQVDKKGIAWFLGITFSLTILVTIILWLKGFSLTGKPSIVVQLTLASVMFIPAIASIIVRKLITKENFKDAGLKFGNWKLYIHTYILIPSLFILAFILTAILISKPDLSLTIFAEQLGINIPLPPWQMILGIVFGSLTFGPIINTIFSFGEELGWRGYLLPKLLPLGKVKALFISGVIWGLWHTPFIILLGMHYGEQRILGVLIFTVMVMLLGVYIGYLRIISGSVILASFAHGIFNSQFYGVWMAIFPNVNPILGGMSGLTGILMLSIVTIWILNKKSIKL